MKTKRQIFQRIKEVSKTRKKGVMIDKPVDAYINALKWVLEKED